MSGEKVTLEAVLGTINLCKFGSIDGEKVEVLVRPNPSDAREREFFVGIKGGLNRERFSFVFSDGELFDNEVLPTILKEYLSGDTITSWTVVDSNQDEMQIKSLIETSNENDFIIQTENIELLRKLRDKIELSTPKLDNELEMSSDDKYCETIFSYLRGRSETKDTLDKINVRDKKIAIDLIEGAIVERKSSNKKLSKYLEDNKNDENKEVCDLLINDIVSSKSFITNQLKEYIKNEHKYSSYYADEEFVKMLEVGKDIIRAGYFDARYSFPRGALNFSEEELDAFSNSKANTKYKVLSYVKDYYLKENREEQALIVNKFINYLIKKTKLSKVKRNLNISDVDITSLEFASEVISNDFDELVSVYKLCKHKKLENEKVAVMVKEDGQNVDKVMVSIDTSSSASFDRYEFSFDGKAKFVNEMLPTLINLVKEDDKVIDVKKYNGNRDLEINLMTMESGDELLVSLSPTVNKKTVEDEREKSEFVPANLTKEDLELAGYLRKKALRDRGMLPPVGLREIEGLAVTNSRVKELEDKWKLVLDGKISKDEYDELYSKSLAGLTKTMGLEEVPLQEGVLPFEYRDFPSITDGERKVLLESDEKLEILKHNIKGYLRENEEVKQTPSVVNPRFEELHRLVTKYKVQNVNGIIKVYDRKSGEEVLASSDDLIEDVEFASYWTAALGTRASADDVVLGEKEAFSSEALEFFNILDFQFTESVKWNIPVDFESLYKAFLSTENKEKGEETFSRLFKNQNYFDYVSKYYYKLSKREYIPGTNIVKPRNREIYESDDEYTKFLERYYERGFSKENYKVEPKVESEIKPKPPVMFDRTFSEVELNNIKDVYKKVGEIAKADNPSILTVSFSDDNTNFNVSICCGKEGKNAVLYSNKFNATNARDILPELCNMYISENGVIYNSDFEVPDTEKAGAIIIGKDYNTFRIINAPKEVVKFTQDSLKAALNAEIVSKVKQVQRNK